MSSLTKPEKAQIDSLIWSVAWLEASEDIENFARYVVTKDEHADGEVSVRPFPLREDKPYVWDIIDTIRTQNLIAIEKSRQLMVTWIVCLFCLWYAKFNRNRLIFIQSKKEEDAANLVFNSEWSSARISFMESNLPEQLRSDIGCSYSKLFFRDTGSRIWGIPEGGDQIRSYTASLIASDEAAFQPEFEAAWKAASPSIKGGGKFIAISSARNGAFMKQLIRRA